MLSACKRMFSNIASLKIPEISKRMAIKFLTTLEEGWLCRLGRDH